MPSTQQNYVANDEHYNPLPTVGLIIIIFYTGITYVDRQSIESWSHFLKTQCQIKKKKKYIYIYIYIYYIYIIYIYIYM